MLRGAALKTASLLPKVTKRPSMYVIHYSRRGVFHQYEMRPLSILSQDFFPKYSGFREQSLWFLHGHGNLVIIIAASSIWKRSRSSAILIHRLPAMHLRSLDQRIGGSLTLRLPVFGLHTRTFVPHWLQVLRQMWSAYCYFNYLMHRIRKIHHPSWDFDRPLTDQWYAIGSIWCRSHFDKFLGFDNVKD